MDLYLHGPPYPPPLKSGQELQPLITVRRYRTVGQLIVEWILGLVAFFSLAAGPFGLSHLPRG